MTGVQTCALPISATAEWLAREMQSAAGGFYSTLDADSEHEEGKFYVWAPDAARALLTAEEYAVAAAHYGLDRPPNFENRHWHLQVTRPLAAVAQALGVAHERAQALLAQARAKLFAGRAARVRPARDEKILTAWNALAIKGKIGRAHV